MAARPNLGQRRTTSSVHLSSRSDTDDGGAPAGGGGANDPGAQRKTKQFVAGGHGHRHNRVPSYGRGLNKLTQQQITKLTQTMSHGDLVAVAKAAAAQGLKSQSTSPTHPKTKDASKEHFQLPNKRPHNEGELKKRSRSREGKMGRTSGSKKMNSAPGSYDDITVSAKAEKELAAEEEFEDEEEDEDGETTELLMAPIRSDRDPFRAAMTTPPHSPQQTTIILQSTTMHTNGSISKSPVAAQLQLRTTGPTPAESQSPAKKRISFGLPLTAKHNDVPDAQGESADMFSEPAQTSTQPHEHQPKPSVSTEPSSYFHPKPPQPSKSSPKVSTESATGTQYLSLSSQATGSGGTQPVTSRFITSDSDPSAATGSYSGSSAAATPRRRSVSGMDNLLTPHATPPDTEGATFSSASTAVNSHTDLSSHYASHRTLLDPTYVVPTGPPNRSLAKVLLTRQSSQFDLPDSSGGEQSSTSNYSSSTIPVTYTHHHHTRDNPIDRIAREYANVRKFVSPVNDALLRLQNSSTKRIPRYNGGMTESGAGQLGLSQSLGAGEQRKAVGIQAQQGSKDDIAAGKRRSLQGGSGSIGDRHGKMDEAGIRELLLHVWSREGASGSVNLATS